MRVCIYGAARETIDKEYIKEGEKLGKLFAKNGIELVFGAGRTGMMGAVSRGVLENGGRIIGVTPNFMEKFEPVAECTETIYTATMHERKFMMETLADAFVVTPGGIGTYDEFFEILTLRQLEQTTKPIIVMNYNGCFNRLISLLNDTAENGFMDYKVLSFLQVVRNADDVVEILKKL